MADNNFGALSVDGLDLQRTQATTKFEKAKPPRTGNAYGDWAGRTGVEKIMLPGGSVLQFDLSKLTLADYRQMLDHYQVNIATQILTTMLFSIDWWVEHENPEIEEFLQEEMERLWIQIVRGTSQARWAGYSPMVLQWENDPISGYTKIDKIKDLFPEESRVHWKTNQVSLGRNRPSIKRYSYNGISQGTWSPSIVDGGYQDLHFKRKDQIRIPPEATYWYTNQMPNGDYYGKKMLRPAFPSYFFSTLLHMWANRYFERFGEPVPIGRAPFDDDVTMPGGQVVKGSEAMEHILDNLRSRAAVVLPSKKGFGDDKDFEYQIEYIESQMRGADFERYMARQDEEISLALFLPVLLYRVSEIGSFNLGESHLRLFQTSRNYEARDIGDGIQRYIMRRLIDVNFGTEVPNAKFQFRQMGKDRDETTRAILQSAIQQELIAPNVDEISQLIGVKMHEVVQISDPLTPDTSDSDTHIELAPGQSKDDNVVTTLRNTVSSYKFGDTEIRRRNEMWRSLMRDNVPSDKAEKAVATAFARTEHWLAFETENSDEATIRAGLSKVLGGHLTDALSD